MPIVFVVLVVFLFHVAWGAGGEMGALAGKNRNKSKTNPRQIKFVEICIKFY